MGCKYVSKGRWPKLEELIVGIRCLIKQKIRSEALE
jgi:hypothetical protein